MQTPSSLSAELILFSRGVNFSSATRKKDLKIYVDGIRCLEVLKNKHVSKTLNNLDLRLLLLSSC